MGIILRQQHNQIGGIDQSIVHTSYQALFICRFTIYPLEDLGIIYIHTSINDWKILGIEYFIWLVSRWLLLTKLRRCRFPIMDGQILGESRSTEAFISWLKSGSFEIT